MGHMCRPSTETVPPGNIALTVLRNATLKEGRFRGTAVLWYHLKQPCCDQNGSTPERGSTNDWCERAMSARQNITGVAITCMGAMELNKKN